MIEDILAVLVFVVVFALTIAYQIGKRVRKARLYGGKPW